MPEPGEASSGVRITVTGPCLQSIFCISSVVTGAFLSNLYSIRSKLLSFEELLFHLLNCYHKLFQKEYVLLQLNKIDQVLEER